MSEYSLLVTYVLALGLAALIPGPGMTAMLLTTLATGYRSGLKMLFGLITGDLIFLMLSLFGMVYLNQISSHASQIIVMISSVYLMYLACQFWQWNAYIGMDSDGKQDAMFHKHYQKGLLITLSNPKTISFYLALVPSIFGTARSGSLVELAILVLMTVLTLFIVGILYIFGAMKMKLLLSQPKMQQRLFKLTAVLLFGVAAKMLLETIWTNW